MTAAGLPAKGFVVKASTCSKGTVIIGAGARVSNRTARTLKSTRRKRTDGPRSDHTRATLRTDLPRSSNFFWCGQPPHSSQIAESLRRAGGRARPRRCLRQRDFATPQSIVGCLVCHAKTHALAANSGFLLPKLAGFAVQAQRRAAPCSPKICPKFARFAVPYHRGRLHFHWILSIALIRTLLVYVAAATRSSAYPVSKPVNDAGRIYIGE
jgi:hypothetical protein